MYGTCDDGLAYHLQLTDRVRACCVDWVRFSQAEDLREMAQACQEDGCSVETVSNLLDQLKAKQKELQVLTFESNLQISRRRTRRLCRRTAISVIIYVAKFVSRVSKHRGSAAVMWFGCCCFGTCLCCD